MERNRQHNTAPNRATRPNRGGGGKIKKSARQARQLAAQSKMDSAKVKGNRGQNLRKMQAKGRRNKTEQLQQTQGNKQTKKKKKKERKSGSN